MSTVIKPTPGRVVWFYPNIHFLGVRPDVDQPLGARIARVWNDRMVNLAVDDANGAPCSVTSVPLLQEGDDIPTDGRSYCTWMPYQLGQAAKHEAKNNTDASIEQEIQAKGLTAPRITPTDVEANIVSEYYFTAGQGVDGAQRAASLSSSYCYQKSLDLLTFCVLALQNGFTVTGESACASPENFDAELGRKIARQNAIQKVWPLMGYELRSKLSA